MPCCTSADTRGWSQAITWVVSIAVISGVALFFTDGLAGVLLLYLAILPVLVVLFGLRLSHENDMPLALYVEMFLTGCVLSIGLATLLEGLAQTQTLAVWQCERSPMFTWQCDVMFVIVVTIAVGLSEEVAKFAPLSRIKGRTRYLPQSWWFRVAETPYAICLCGVAAAGGFACVENVKYTLRTGRMDLEYGIDTSIFRAVLAIPFHVACTGYASAQYAMEGFMIPRFSASETAERPKSWLKYIMSCLRRNSRQATVNDTLQTASLGYDLLPVVDQSAIDDVSHLENQATMVYKPPGIWKLLAILALPALCHGFYDSGLFLAAQFMTAGSVAEKRRASLAKVFKLEEEYTPRNFHLALVATSLPFYTTNSPLLSHVEDLLSHTNSINDRFAEMPLGLPPLQDPRAAYHEATAEAAMYFSLGFTSLALALGSYFTILSLFFIRWRKLGHFQRKAVPMLHEHYDIPF